MSDYNAMSLVKLQKLQAVGELRDCNSLSARYGLSLSDAQILSLVEKRFTALKETGRVEFGEGILKKLVYAFCDSPYIMREEWEETLGELQDCFYYFKTESNESLTDDELISYMKSCFNEECQGSVDYLYGTSLEALCHGEYNKNAPLDGAELILEDDEYEE